MPSSFTALESAYQHKGGNSNRPTEQRIRKNGRIQHHDMRCTQTILLLHLLLVSRTQQHCSQYQHGNGESSEQQLLREGHWRLQHRAFCLDKRPARKVGRQPGRRRVSSNLAGTPSVLNYNIILSFLCVSGKYFSVKFVLYI